MNILHVRILVFILFTLPFHIKEESLISHLLFVCHAFAEYRTRILHIEHSTAPTSIHQFMFGLPLNNPCNYCTFIPCGCSGRLETGIFFVTRQHQQFGCLHIFRTYARIWLLNFPLETNNPSMLIVIGNPNPSSAHCD